MMLKTLCSLLRPMTKAHLLAFHTFKAGRTTEARSGAFPSE